MLSKSVRCMRALGLLALLASVTGLGGCGGLQTLMAANKQSDENKDYENSDFKHDPHLAIVSAAPRKLGVNGPAPITNTCKGKCNSKFTPPDDPHRRAILSATDSATLIHEFGLMAAFSAMAYHRHVPVNDRYRSGPDQGSGANQDACVLNDEGHPLPALMEVIKARAMQAGIQNDLWERWQGGKAPACISEDGLFYETYVLQRDGSGPITDAVIVFRGTENTPGQLTADWTDNVSAALYFEPHQYKLARERLKETLQALLKVNAPNNGPTPRIYAAGHSLGGGLAQMAVYANKEILAAYAFNTSAVTNWSYLKLHDLVQVTDPVIYRIHQRGEFLGNLRAVTSRVNSRRFGRSDFEFNYQEDGGEVAKHSISLLACHFAGFIAAQDKEPLPPPAFGYDKLFATQLFKHNLTNPQDHSYRAEKPEEDLETLCKLSIREKVCVTEPAKGADVCAAFQ